MARKHFRSIDGPSIPLKPLQDWVDAELAARRPLVAGSSSRRGVPMAEGWLADRMGISVRTLHRIRKGIGTGKTITGASGGRYVTYSYGITTWARYRVEDMLERAGADFYDVYPQFAHERDIELEPECWCEGCRDVVTPVNGICLWCDSVVSKPQFEDAA